MSRDVRMTRRWSTATCTIVTSHATQNHKPKTCSILPSSIPSLSPSHTHTHTPRVATVLAMPVLVAASVSGGFAFLSHFSSSSDNAPQNALPPSSINFSNCWTKRPALLSPAKVSLSSGSSTQTDDGVDQSSLTDDFKQARVCVFSSIFVLYSSISANV